MLDIFKMKPWMHMGRTANIIIKDMVTFVSICKTMLILLMGWCYHERRVRYLFYSRRWISTAGRVRVMYTGYAVVVIMVLHHVFRYWKSISKYEWHWCLSVLILVVWAAGCYDHHHVNCMMTSSNGSNFRVTGPLCGEFTGARWIPRTKASDVELWCFLWSAPE